jgi:hypothetical protein
MQMTMVMGAATAQKIQNWRETRSLPEPSAAVEKKEDTLKIVF